MPKIWRQVVISIKICIKEWVKMSKFVDFLRGHNLIKIYHVLNIAK